MKMYVSKYALTDGIKEVDAEIEDGREYVRPKGYFNSLKIGKDIHTTYYDAATRAEEMRTAKLKSLDKQMRKLAALKFDN